MKQPDVKRATLEELRRSKDAGELFHDPGALPGDALGSDFWRGAVCEKSPVPNPAEEIPKPSDKQPHALDLRLVSRDDTKISGLVE